VTFSVLTTVAAFAPMLMVEGNTGKIMAVIPTIVISVLAFSLLESLFVLPAHLGHRRRGSFTASDDVPTRNPWTLFQRRVENGLRWFTSRVYDPVLEWSLAWRYSVVAVGLAGLVTTFSLTWAGHIRFTFFPTVEADFVGAFLTMPQGTPADVTESAVRHLETQALAMQSEFPDGTFRHVLASIGDQPFRTAQAQNAGNTGAAFNGSHLGEVTIELAPAESRTVLSEDIANRWRERVGTVPDATELSFNASLFSTGEDINVQFTGPSLAALEGAAATLKARLGAYPGVRDITDSFRAGKAELDLDITPEAEALGISLADLGRQVRQAFYGEEVQRVQRGREDIRVMVRYPESERRSVGHLESMWIRTPEGAEVPFSVVGRLEGGRGYATISRTDRNRSISVTADVDTAAANANEIAADLEMRVLPEIMAAYPSLRYTFEGQREEQRETMTGLVRGFALALFVIYALLAIPFKSYLQPVIVMSAIPFGLIGAIWGHVLMGMDLTVLSMFGIVALTGVVVNDSLVMVDFINRAHRAGRPVTEAIRVAGIQRFRPILLTSLTTFAGLTPLLLERSVQAQFLIPMAVSLAFGVIFATVVTLILVPVGYLMLEDVYRILPGAIDATAASDSRAAARTS
jgi:multidrug efflux pump subunit AcrB